MKKLAVVTVLASAMFLFFSTTSMSAERGGKIRLQGDAGRIQFVKEIIRLTRPADYQRITFEEVVSDRGVMLLASAPAAQTMEDIKLTNRLLKDVSNGIISGDASKAIGLCVKQTTQLARVVDAALSVANRAQVTQARIKKVSCPSCKVANPASPKPCTDIIGWVYLSNGEVADIKVCNLDKNGATDYSRERYVSASAEKKADSWALHVRLYDRYYHETYQLNPDDDYWGWIGDDVKNHLTYIAGNLPQNAHYGQIYCWRKFPAQQ